VTSYARRIVKTASGEAAAEEAAGHAGRYVEPLNDGRMKLEAVFTIL
jgi:hypothetical protein